MYYSFNGETKAFDLAIAAKGYAIAQSPAPLRQPFWRLLRLFRALGIYFWFRASSRLVRRGSSVTPALHPLDRPDNCSKHVSVQLRHMTMLSMICPCTTGNAAVSRTAVMHMSPITHIASFPNLPRRHQLHMFSPVSKCCHCGSSSKLSPVCSLHTAAASSSIRSQQPAKLAVFVSGGGSNFRAIHDAILSGHIHAQIAVRLKTRCLAFCVAMATDVHGYSDRLL